MLEFLTTPTAQITLLTGATAALLAMGCYVIRRFRPADSNSAPFTSELITNFRQLHSRGQLTDEEYRTIKTKLASRLQDEIEDTPSEGPAS